MRSILTTSESSNPGRLSWSGRLVITVSVLLLLAGGLSLASPRLAAGSDAAAWPVDIVILGGEGTVFASVAAELKTCTTGSVTRLAGTNRYLTATAVSKATFVSADGAYIATGLNFPDALAGGPPAALSGQPVLLVNDAVLVSTRVELTRLGVSSVTVLGGPAVVPDSVVTSLNAFVPTTRIAGSDRYSTAAAIVQAKFASANTVYVATGLNFPDALAGVPAAASDAAPILLVQQNAIPAATTAQLSRLNPTTIKILGGEAVISAGVAASLGSYASNVIRLSGSDRYATAAAISQHAFPSGASKIYIATGLNSPDALAGGPAAGVNDAPILLVQPNSIPSPTAAEIERITGTTCAPTTPPPTDVSISMNPNFDRERHINKWTGTAGSDSVSLTLDSSLDNWSGTIGSNPVSLTLDSSLDNWSGTIGSNPVSLTFNSLLDNWTGTIGSNPVSLTFNSLLDNWTGTIGSDLVSLTRFFAPVRGSGPVTAAALVPILFGPFPVGWDSHNCTVDRIPMWGDVYVTSSSINADVNVWHAASEIFNDLVVRPVSSSALADRCGSWHFVSSSNLADFDVYFTSSPITADLEVYFTSHTFL